MARLQGLMNLQNRLSACRVCRTHLAVPAILAVAPKTPFQLPPGYRECTNETEISTSRPLTKFTSGVLAALRGSTYGGEYASPLRLLRPCWTPLLNSLRLLLNESVSIRVSQGVHAYHHKRSASTLTPIIREKVKPDSFVYKTVYAGLDVRSITTDMSTAARYLSAHAATTSTTLKTFTSSQTVCTLLQRHPYEQLLLVTKRVRPAFLQWRTSRLVTSVQILVSSRHQPLVATSTHVVVAMRRCNFHT